MSQEPAITSGCFPTTKWTVLLNVIQEGDAAAAASALESFCAQYRPAIRNFFVRRGVDPDEAEEYTQNFFLQRILKPWEGRDGFLHAAQRREAGKFRSFLSHVLWLHLQDEWRRKSAMTTGGGPSKFPCPTPSFGRRSFAAFRLRPLAGNWTANWQWRSFAKPQRGHHGIPNITRRICGAK